MNKKYLKAKKEMLEHVKSDISTTFMCMNSDLDIFAEDLLERRLEKILKKNVISIEEIKKLIYDARDEWLDQYKICLEHNKILDSLR